MLLDYFNTSHIAFEYYKITAPGKYKDHRAAVKQWSNEAKNGYKNVNRQVLADVIDKAAKEQIEHIGTLS